MIRKVVIRRFKRFEEVVFDLPGHVVLAGPNNSGKTTIFQALVAWHLVLREWTFLNDRARRNGGYTWAPIARPNFTPVPLRDFELLWYQRKWKEPIEIEVTGRAGWSIAIELKSDSKEQVYARPRSDTALHHLESAALLPMILVPPMSGLIPDEGLWARYERVEALLGQARTGEVLRNLLYHASESPTAWRLLTESVESLFDVELLPPQVGASIIAEYVDKRTQTRLDLGSAGSGFLQVVMLLSFLHTNPGSVLLLDEPDAHLHVILQDAVYSELLSIAARHSAQLVIATHSEVIINAADLADIRLSFDPSRPLIDENDREALHRAMRHLSNVDMLQAKDAPGVLYLEDYTDLAILREWARILAHPAHELLTTRLYWRRMVTQSGEGIDAVQAKDHYESLRLVRPDLPGVILVDGDARKPIAQTEITGRGLQRLRWRRYEIESYLLHPDVLARFVARQVGPGMADAAVQALRAHLEGSFPPNVIAEPLGDHAFLNGTKARTELLPPALSAAGLPGFPYQRFHEIAAIMLPAEIHPEVVEKLDHLCKAFGVAV